MTWEIFYVVVGAPLLMLLAGLSAVGVTKLLERRERRLYGQGGKGRLPDQPSAGVPH